MVLVYSGKINSSKRFTMNDIISQRIFYTVLIFFVVTVGSFGFLSSACAITNVFEVRNVVVDVTGESASLARKKALVQGTSLAFRRLLERLTLNEDHKRLPRLDQDGISSLVSSFDVADEKTASKRYLAKLSYKFKQTEVRNLLEKFNLQFAETLSKPVLILPVYQAEGTTVLWDDPNPWRDAWAQAVKFEGMVPLVNPVGDLADFGSIGPEQAIKGDRNRLQAIADRYKTGAVIVAYAQLRLDAVISRQRLDVFVTRFGIDPEPITEKLRYHQNKTEPISMFLGRAALAVGKDIENKWKHDNLLKLNRLNVAAIAIPITGIKHWLLIQSRLNGVALIRNLDLVLLALDEARVNLHYVGEPEQLRVALGQADLAMVQEDGEWIIYLADLVKP
jgi:hypothetical protein